jgi:regulatory protein
LAKARKTVTALRDVGHGRVRVELDGEPWRVLPVDALARAGIAEGLELDRPRLRTLAGELRRTRALGLSIRALGHRDLSERQLRERLGRAGIAPAGAEEAVALLRRAALVDDARLASARAQALAERGLGDAAIRSDLERQGVPSAELEAALARLEPERERAARVVSARGSGPATARYLARRGFDEDAVEAAAGADVAPDA